jgi:hypothetical protein
MKAPEAATRLVAGAGVVTVVTGAVDVVVEGSLAGGVPVVEVEVSATDVVDVEESAVLPAPEPREQAVPAKARMSNRTRRFTGSTIGRRIRRS